MTSPATLDRLRVVAGWDPVVVRGARATLAAVAERLLSWRARLDASGRELLAADSWAGPSADAAAGIVEQLSGLAAAVQTALDLSQEGWDALAVAAADAQGLAVRALVATGPEAPLTAAASALAPPGWLPDPVAEGALARAEAAAAGARAAADALSGLTAPAAGAAPGLDELMARAGHVLVPPVVPAGGTPRDVASWWASLPAAAQWSLVERAPAQLGSLDGVPAWARDRANRLLLDAALDDPGLPAGAARTARVVAGRIAAEEAAGRPVQLQLLDLEGDRVVLALGDLDTADAVAVLVPGVGTAPADDLDARVGDARDVAVAARAAAPASAVAVVVWLGYRTPSTLPSMLTRGAAQRGGAALAAALDGLAAARAAAGSADPRTTVVAHSYGTVVVDEAADRPGPLVADAVVLLGSPGMEDDAEALEAAEVYDAGSVADPISWSGWFGLPPGSPLYGSSGLPAAAWTGHSHYYDPGGPTLGAIGEVVAGVRAPR